MAGWSYIRAGVAAAWNALTPAQRTSWYDLSQAITITNVRGELTAVNGWQLYCHANAIMQVAGYTPLLTDAPADLTPPDPIDITVTSWPTKSRRATGVTDRAPRLFIAPDYPIPTDVVVVVFQGRAPRYNSAGWWHSTCNVTALLPGATGAKLLRGTRATGGEAKAGRTTSQMLGVRARIRPGDVIGRTIAVRVDTGGRALGRLTFNPPRPTS